MNSRGKKRIVADAVASSLNTKDPMVLQVLERLSCASSWREANPLLALLGPTGELLANPGGAGLALPGRGNWGLPNVSRAAQMILRQPFPSRGNGWAFCPA